MKSKSEKRGTALILIGIVAVMALLVSAVNIHAYSSAGNWSSYAVMTLNASDSWKRADHSSLKATGNDVATFFVDSKTMYTSPDAKLINSKGENRSAIVSLSSVNTRINAAGNTGTKGYYYYSKVKPSGFQIGQDSIKYKIMAD